MLTCHVVHGVPLPPSVDHEYVDQVIAFTSKMWGQWYVGYSLCLSIRSRISPFIQLIFAAFKGSATRSLRAWALALSSTSSCRPWTRAWQVPRRTTCCFMPVRRVMKRGRIIRVHGLTILFVNAIILVQAMTARSFHCSRPLGSTTTCMYALLRACSSAFLGRFT